MSRLRAVLTVVVTSYCGFALAQEVQWAHAFGKDGRFYNPTAVAGAPDGSSYVAGTATAPGLGGSEPEFWVWKINADGDVVQQTPIAAGAAEDVINPSVSHIRDIVATASGGALIVEFVLGDPYYVAFDADTRVTRMQRMEIPERTFIHVNRLLAGEGGDVLAIGKADGNAFVFRIDGEGKVVWSARPAVGDVFMDGAALPGRGLVAVGYSSAKPGEFSLTYFDPDGNIRKSVSLKGRRVSIAAANGGEVLVYDRASGDARDIHVATVTDGVLSADAALSPSLIPPIQIAQTSGDRHLLGAKSEDRGVVVMLYADGKVAPLFQSDPDQAPKHWSLERLNGFPASALTSVYASGRPLTTKVGFIRFKEE
jgi:hypothetical protein